MDIGTDDTNPAPDLLINNASSDHTHGDDSDDEDGAVDDPTVEAHVDLTKRARKYYLTNCCAIFLLKIYSAQSLS